MKHLITRLLIENGYKRRVDVKHRTTDLEAYRRAVTERYHATKVNLTYETKDTFKILEVKLRSKQDGKISEWEITPNTITQNLENYKKHLLKKHNATEIINLKFKEL